MSCHINTLMKTSFIIFYGELTTIAPNDYCTDGRRHWKFRNLLDNNSLMIPSSYIKLRFAMISTIVGEWSDGIGGKDDR